MEEFCKTVRDIVQRAYWRIDKIYTGEKCMKIIDRLREDGNTYFLSRFFRQRQMRDMTK